jgi:hypothetical protein
MACAIPCIWGVGDSRLHVIAGATYSQALCALLFLYKTVLQIELPWIEGIRRPSKPPRRPTVLTPPGS